MRSVTNKNGFTFLVEEEMKLPEGVRDSTDEEREAAAKADAKWQEEAVNIDKERTAKRLAAIEKYPELEGII